MAIITVKDLNKEFNGEYLFKGLSLNIDEKDKIGLIGVNGAGKTTFIKILLGIENHSPSIEENKFGLINKKRGLKVGYLSQNLALNEENSVFDELMSVFSNLKEDYENIQILNKRLATDLDNFDEIMDELSTVSSRYELAEGYSVEYKVKQILNGLNFPEALYPELITNLSGGQKSRIALGKILLSEPDLLILDEPTNHLDLNAIEWLESFLKEYNKAFILISHDRYFLNSVTDSIVELENKTINRYKGNFDDYLIQKEAYLSGAVKAYDKEQDKIKKMEEFIRRYKAGVKSKQARGREKLLNRMEKMDNPVLKNRKIKLKFESKRLSGENILKIDNLKKDYDNKVIFENLNMRIYRGDRVGIIGKNGVGKSTLLNIINGLELPTSGLIEFGEKIDVSYYDQEHSNVSGKNTILEELLFSYPISEEMARNICGGFLFSSDDAEKRLTMLSGGEKARVSFMKLIMDKPNFLILDEPTNHLDIYSREVLEESLEDYDGTLLVVSHDRHFLEAVTNKIYEVDKNGATLFNGNYEDYIKNKSEEVKIKKDNDDYEMQKQNKNRINSIKRKMSSLEDEIIKIEEAKTKVRVEFDKATKKNCPTTLMEVQAELEKLEAKELSIMDELESYESELFDLMDE